MIQEELRPIISRDLVWLVYGQDPGSLPRSWRGLVGYKRLDVVLRVVLAALYPCGDLARDSLLALFLDKDSKGETGNLVLLAPDCLPQKALYEHDIGPVLLKALRGEECNMVTGLSLLYLVRMMKRNNYRVVGLSEGGEPLDPVMLQGKLVIILGSYFDPPRRVLDEADKLYSIGPYSYLASHVAAFINAVRLGVIHP